MAPTDCIDQLFALVDQDNDGALDFGEVTALFQQLAPKQSAASAQNAAVEALLMADRSLDTQLNRQEFAVLLSKVAEASGLPLQEAARRLLDVAQGRHQPPPTVPPPDILQAGETPAAADATPAPPPAAAAAAATEEPDVISVGDQPPPAAAAAAEGVSPAAVQLRTLFDLWDTAGDGHINFVELCQGLGKMRRPIKHKKDMTGLIMEAGSVLAAHDVDGDRQLDFQEFTSFMQQFMAAAGFQLTEVLEELVILARTKPDNEKLQKVLDAAQPQIQLLLSK